MKKYHLNLDGWRFYLKFKASWIHLPNILYLIEHINWQSSRKIDKYWGGG